MHKLTLKVKQKRTGRIHSETATERNKMHMDKQNHVRLTLEISVLQRLLDSGALCANEFSCLDCDSKHCVWKLCLMNCAKHMSCSNHAHNNYEHCNNSQIPASITLTTKTLNQQETVSC